MVAIKYCFVLLLSAACAVLATVADIEAQLTICTGFNTNMNNVINTFSCNSMASVLQLNAFLTASGNLSESLTVASGLISMNGPLSDDDASTIFDIIIPCGVRILNSLSVIVARKSFFGAVGGSLANLENSVIDFANAFITVAPASVLPAATSLRTNVSEAFDSALGAFTM